MNKKINNLRQEIDLIDEQLLAILTKRAYLCEQVQQIKTQANIAIVNPTREQQIITKVQQHNQSKISTNNITDIFLTIIKSCRELQLDK